MRSSPRRPVLGALAVVSMLGLVAACGSGGASSEIQLWGLQDDLLNESTEQIVASYNENAETPVNYSYYVNDPYKERLQVALGSPQGPDVWLNWGGGNLSQFVEAGQVTDLTPMLEQEPELRDAFLPSVMEVGTVDGSVYALPMVGTQPVLLYFNQEVFDEAGVEPPQTYDDLLELVDVFTERDITPIVLPGQQAWTEMFWLAYLTERIGGPDVFQAVIDGEEGAWRDPAMIEAMERCQELVEAGAFGTSYASVTYDGGAATELLTSGEAAMFLMGTWEYGSQLASAPEFVESSLGWTTFPMVEDGEGDPQALVGNPSNYFSITANSEHVDASFEFLAETLTSDAYLDSLLELGQVPPVVGIEDRLAASPGADHATWVYDLVDNASSYTQVWDQAMTPAQAEVLLTNIQRLFLNEITPDEFAAAMEQAS
ncbi:ABC transporter substrate-binding protein [Allonocardiopsis opalescens]|uniref:Carbohydrate ABC transporter substrate-binding protein (CUT1 family) n=1 Tax=Allonocardiopsis opalescens TaxID=1144618 RepID=A0A2T0PX59_9ACTN|nr:extracellular solute-binding protein [Allonocardiopsis opalescens]PRX96124.1 carbohydrate ABC transporter substrate-binding protein (CUT1 family) [Allonocardiopsis opalescens]